MAIHGEYDYYIFIKKGMRRHVDRNHLLVTNNVFAYSCTIGIIYDATAAAVARDVGIAYVNMHVPQYFLTACRGAHHAWPCTMVHTWKTQCCTLPMHMPEATALTWAHCLRGQLQVKGVIVLGVPVMQDGDAPDAILHNADEVVDGARRPCLHESASREEELITSADTMEGLDSDEDNIEGGCNLTCTLYHWLSFACCIIPHVPNVHVHIACYIVHVIMPCVASC